jgi:hypothetical protein
VNVTMARFIGTKNGVLDTRRQRLSLVLPAPKDTRKREDIRKTSAVDFNVTDTFLVGGAL